MTLRATLLVALAFFGVGLAASCGGKAAFEAVPGGDGGGGPGSCVDHNDCPQGTVCIYDAGVGTCAPTCTDACAQGLVCNPCASSSCPTCDDCIAACVPAKDGLCDGPDDCPGMGDVCVYATSTCAPACQGDSPCPGGYVCDECATSSCLGCRDCVGACVPPTP